MADEELLITPLAGSKGSIKLECSDLLLFTAELNRFVHGVDFIESSSTGDSREVIGEGSVVSVREGDLSCRVESQAVRVLHTRDRFTILSVSSEIAEANLLDPRSSTREFLSQRQKCGTSCRNVVREIILEEVPAFLSINTVHSNQISRINTIT